MTKTLDENISETRKKLNAVFEEKADQNSINEAAVKVLAFVNSQPEEKRNAMIEAMRNFVQKYPPNTANENIFRDILEELAAVGLLDAVKIVCMIVFFASLTVIHTLTGAMVAVISSVFIIVIALFDGGLG